MPHYTTTTDPDLESLAAVVSKKLDEKDVSPDNKNNGNNDAPGSDIVSWDGPADPECPRNWKPVKKFFFTVITSSVILTVSFGSSVFAPATAVTAAQFGVSPTVMQLSVTLWILGLAAGPVLFGPLSEVFGHLIPFAVAVVGLAAFQLPVALATGVPAILVGRFLAGAFGSGTFAIVSGQYFELYEPTRRGVAMALSATCINLGATIAPIAGAFLTYNHDGDRRNGWAWTAWTTLIIASGLGLAALCGGVRESSSRRILEGKARRQRLATRNWALHARSEESPLELGDIAHQYLTKPARMFATEPILAILTAYLTLVYGTLYLAFQAFPLAYRQRGWSVTASELPFVAVTLGIVSAGVACAVFALTWYKTQVARVEKSHGALSPQPEWRLPPMALGAVILPPALLWFGWSGNVHWMSQVVASYFIGLGLQLIFVAGITYIVDVYQENANSAMSIHVVVRSLVASSFPLFATAMYDRLGVAWASSVLALLSLVMAPAPVLFWLYGSRIRSWSHFSATAG
ncbi:hypothetical protein SLS62_001467 [Diatrype stigma]|uniref:Major facilitator superfamily (MFS) profile domain-containing protein n=1 Tax=Diatrype stigma TaxID=117547 RepID=A0AAN9UWA1_9PEZI